MINKSENYIFVDLEWDQCENKPSKKDLVIAIGATRLSGNTKFYRCIKTKRVVRNRTRRILNLKQEEINKGVYVKDAMDDFKEYVGTVDNIVVWSYHTRDKFVDLARKFNCAYLTKKIIILQEVIKELSGSENVQSFDGTLVSMNVEYDAAFLHNAGFDAKCLKDLFIKVVNKYEDMNPVLSSTFFVNSKSKVLHTSDCTYLKNIADTTKIIGYKCIIGYKPCKRCLKKINLLIPDIESRDDIKNVLKIRNYKGRGVNIDQIREIVDFFGLSISGNLEKMTISTKYSHWQVFCNSHGYVDRLRHENYSDRNRIKEQFHEHKVFPKDVYSAIEYIYMHDEKSGLKTMEEDLKRRQHAKEKKRKQQKLRRSIVRDEWEEYYNIK